MSESPTADDIARRRKRMLQLERWLKLELRRFKLSHQEHVIAEIIVELSYGWGNKHVAVPKIEFLSEISGLARPHVASTISRLNLMRIVTGEKINGIMHYLVNPNSDTWQATPRTSRARIKNAIDLLKPANGYHESLTAEMAAVKEELKDIFAAGDPENFNVFDDADFFICDCTDSVPGTDSDQSHFNF